MNTYYRSHVDDASAFLTHHDRSTSMNEVESGFQVNVDNHIPLLFGHTHHQTVTSNTCIVNQNINAAEICMNSLYYFGSIFKARCIRCICFGFYSKRFNFFCCCLSIFINHQVSECNICSFLSELQSDSLADAACSTCHNGCFSI